MSGDDPSWWLYENPTHGFMLHCEMCKMRRRINRRHPGKWTGPLTEHDIEALPMRYLLCLLCHPPARGYVSGLRYR
jgi:hypothetical protein